ncbi:MAG: amino acid ABC transporter permease [Ottowia sp.]|nr:amino acid ABC transporter permease [Ottowia sp.]
MLDIHWLAPHYLRWLFNGGLVTVALSICVITLATLPGFFLAIGKNMASRWIRYPIILYLSVLRNTPLLVQLLVWYFGVSSLLNPHLLQWLNTSHTLPGLGIPWPSFEFIASLFGLTLYSSAFIAEEIRAGINGVANAQKDAARALGLSSYQVWRWIVLPQAFRIAFRPLLGQYMNVVKNTSLTMAIGLAELSYTARQVETETLKTFPAFAIATLLYIFFVAIIEAMAQWHHPTSIKHR